MERREIYELRSFFKFLTKRNNKTVFAKIVFRDIRYQKTEVMERERYYDRKYKDSAAYRYYPGR